MDTLDSDLPEMDDLPEEPIPGSSKTNRLRNDDEENYPENNQPKKRKRYTKEELDQLGKIFEEADRFGASDMATANIVNAAYSNIGIINPNNNSEVLCQNKVNRLRKKARLQRVENKKGKKPLAVGIDERKDTSKVKVGENEAGNKKYQFKKVENCSVVFWPNTEFVGHIVTSGGSGKALAEDLVKFFEMNETDTSSLKAGLSDGCNKMRE